MRFSISGADKETGGDIEIIVEASSKAAAQEIANRKGILVSRIVANAARVGTTPLQALTSVVQQQAEQGHQRGAAVINVSPPRRGNSLGIASLILGILAFLICWIPLVNLLGMPLAALGLLLGLIGLLVALTRNGASIGYPIAGSAVCALALTVAVSVTGALVSGIKKASDQILTDSTARNATNQITVPPASPDQYSSPPIASGSTSGDSPPPVQWASAESPVKQEDVQVRVKSVIVGKVPLTETIGGDGVSEDSLLSVEVEIINLSDSKKVDYSTWGGSAMSFDRRASLTDNFGNGYKRVNFGFSSKISGAVESESIYPGKAISDVLVFEPPVGKAEYLNLELPAEQFGGTGMLRIRIPASMIQR
jgi:hypothetical protein